jgi:hypothetical protein
MGLFQRPRRERSCRKKGETLLIAVKTKMRWLTVCLGPLLACAILLVGWPFRGAHAQFDLSVFQKKGVSEEEQSKDRYECHRVAVQRTGFDPSVRPPDDLPPMRPKEKAELQAQQAVGWRKQQAQYNQALRSCMEGRGYSIAEH